MAIRYSILLATRCTIIISCGTSRFVGEAKPFMANRAVDGLHLGLGCKRIHLWLCIFAFAVPKIDYEYELFADYTGLRCINFF